VRIRYSHEPELLGTAGGVKKMEGWLRAGTFLVVYGDNLMRFELAPLVGFHRDRRALATVVLFESSEPWTGGVVETDATGRVRRFVEKPNPSELAGNLINAGIYLLEPAVLAAIPGGQFCDFAREVFPGLLASGRPVYAVKPRAYIQDVGTPERLAQARRDWENGLAMR
jgi:NDP-sugar pyrophosphorylase family protein